MTAFFQREPPYLTQSGYSDFPKADLRWRGAMRLGDSDQMATRENEVDFVPKFCSPTDQVEQEFLGAISIVH
jgi:hypothetical protein